MRLNDYFLYILTHTVLQTKAALTRAYNKTTHMMPYAEGDIKKGRRASAVAAAGELKLRFLW